jgi:BlaI family penicillinase repressor
LGFDQEGRAYLYRPLVSEKDCISAVSSSFIERVFGGSLSGLVAHFVEGRKLSPKQLRDLRKVMDEK